MSVRKLTIYSFGYRYLDENHPVLTQQPEVFDCRKIKNPHFHPELCELTGLDKKVSDYVMSDDKAQGLLARLALSSKSGPIAFGCVGGRHRSVALAEYAAKAYRAEGCEVEVIHTALQK